LLLFRLGGQPGALPAFRLDRLLGLPPLTPGWGMPGAAVRRGAACAVLPLPDVAGHGLRLIEGARS
jgi:hypothetical protein